MAEISDWSISAGSNTSAPPNGWPEGMAPSDVNNSARENMAVLARWYQDTNGSIDSGGATNAYTVAAKRTVSAYAQGLVIAFKASFANTGAATLNVDSVGATAIKKFNDQDLASGDIESGQIVVCVHDGTYWQMISPPATVITAGALGTMSTQNANAVSISGGAITGITDLAVADGGTGASNASGARTNLGLGSIATQASSNVTITGGSISGVNVTGTVNGTGAAATEVGFRGTPVNTQNNDYTFALSDNGKCVDHGTGASHTWTVPPHSSVAFPIGAIILMTCYAGSVLVSQGSGVTIVWAGTSSTGNRTLSPYGVASLVQTSTDIWFISGVNLT